MTISQDILRAGLAAKAASLALGNLPRKKKRKGLLGIGMRNIVGTSMIQSQAQLIGGM